MNQFTVTAPSVGFSGEGAGVVFKDGVGRVDDTNKEGRAAIEYFRRRGYTLTPVVDEEPGEPEEEADQFDPSKSGVEDVLAYLADADLAEATRVLDAEAAAKKPRVSIVSKREEILDAKQPAPAEPAAPATPSDTTPPAPADDTKGAGA